MSIHMGYMIYPIIYVPDEGVIVETGRVWNKLNMT